MPQRGNFAKMGRTTRKGIAWLKRENFIVQNIPHTRFFKDIFGIGDAIAIKDGEVYFVQFRTNQWGDMKIYEEFFSKHGVNIMVILFKDRELEPYIRHWSRKNLPDNHHGDDNKEDGKIVQDGHDILGEKPVK